MSVSLLLVKQPNFTCEFLSGFKYFCEILTQIMDANLLSVADLLYLVLIFTRLSSVAEECLLFEFAVNQARRFKKK